jgi:hypothetical protein
MALRKGTLFLVGKLRDLMCSVTMLANVRMLFFFPSLSRDWRSELCSFMVTFFRSTF